MFNTRGTTEGTANDRMHCVKDIGYVTSHLNKLLATLGLSHFTQDCSNPVLLYFICFKIDKPNISVEWLATVLRITEVPGLSLGQYIGVPSLPPRNSGIVPKYLTVTSPFIPYRFHNSKSSHH
jgi:hypothetical protein